MQTMPDIIKQLEIYRLENKVPQQEIAAKLGVAFSTVNRWLNRKAKPNKIQSYHIEKMLKIKSTWQKNILISTKFILLEL